MVMIILFSGYYCTTGQSSPTAAACDQGYYCPEGSHEMVECESGTYQDETAKDSCKPCPAGKVHVVYLDHHIDMICIL